MTPLSPRPRGLPRARVSRVARVLAVALALLALPKTNAAAADRLEPRIVNGTITNQYPSVGVLVLNAPTGARAMFCSATLIGCSTVLTAAHCFCPPDPNTGHTPSCMDIHALTADFAGVYFQHAGLFAHASVALHPDYQFGARADVAVIKLAQPVTGIAPSAINTTRLPRPGSDGTVVGFGRTGGDPFVNIDYGIKRRAPMETALCPNPVEGTAHLCYSLASPSDSGTCNGDSGGPLFTDFGDGDVVAGVTSGVFNYGTCLPPAFNFSTNVFTYREWIASQRGDDSTATCGELPAAGSSATQILGMMAAPDPETTGQRFRYDVPASTTVARVALNGEDIGLSGDDPFSQGYNLYAALNREPSTADPACGDDRTDPYKSCEIDIHGPGQLHVLVDRVSGFGRYQLTVTLFDGPPRSTPTATPTRRNAATRRPTRPLGPCIGDCDRDGRIAISELIRGVNVALRGTSPADCLMLDTNADSAASVNELVAAVNAALNGCIAP